jgi:aminomethyltransferase
MDQIKRTPYHNKFVELGATFVDRLGFPAPLSFTTVEEEHRAAREAVGIFDVYYQIAVEVAGHDAAAFPAARRGRRCRRVSRFAVRCIRRSATRPVEWSTT